MQQWLAKAGKVVVLLGGTSAEREISLLSGNAVVGALRNVGVDVMAIDAGRDLVERLLAVRPDRVFIMLHGRGGEDGTVQGLLESMGIPYTGSNVLGSALSMDKIRSKLIWQQLQVPVADFAMLRPDTPWQQVIDTLGKVVVKPVSEGSSIGMSIAGNAAQLEAAFNLAAGYDSRVMAERYIDGKEFTVTLLAGRVLPAIQLGTDHEFYDYNAKYVAQDTRYQCPVDLPAGQLQALNDIALCAFEALGCEGWGRVDVMQNRAGEFFVLEANTVPGMTSHSLVPMSARQAGLSFEQLVMKILFAKESPEAKN